MRKSNKWSKRPDKWSGQTEAIRYRSGLLKPLSALWKDGREVAAWRYELVRRLHPGKRLPMAIQFNLRNLDSPLESAFRDFIKSERNRKGIRKADKLPRNTVSLTWLEVWDLSKR